MGLVVADTSALVSLGVVAAHRASPLEVLFDDHTVVVPERLVDELRDTAAYDDPSGRGAGAILDRLASFDVRRTELDETFPLDDGENAPRRSRTTSGPTSSSATSSHSSRSSTPRWPTPGS